GFQLTISNVTVVAICSGDQVTRRFSMMPATKSSVRFLLWLGAFATRALRSLSRVSLCRLHTRNRTVHFGAIPHFVIDGHEICNRIWGSSEALALNGNVEDFIVTNNSIHNNDNIGIDFIGFERVASGKNDYVRNGVCSGNTVHDIDSCRNPSYGGERSAGGIYCDGSKNILIEDNTIYTSNFGIEVASEHYGKSTSDMTVQNNLVYNCHNAGLIMGDYDAERGIATDNRIIRNIFSGNDTLNGGYGGLCLQYGVKNNVIEDNLFYANASIFFSSITVLSRRETLVSLF
ncbi:MAG: right-handed parallel beta-helix repeat-containing protein, partial [Clostridia bacterium]